MSRPPVHAGRLLRVLLGSALFLAAAIGLGAGFGAGEVGLRELLPPSPALDAIDRAILFDVRLPRVLLAAVLGAALAVAGIAFQAMLRNPLADPYVLGVSGGASIGGVLALWAGLGGAGIAGRLGVPLCAFVGALAALALIEWIATVDGRLGVFTVLLTGAIFNAFSAAAIYLIQSLASLEQLHAIVFYLMGRLPSFDLSTVALLAAATLGVSLWLLSLARDFNALSLGEEGAQQLGVDVERLKRRALVLGSLLTALAVSTAGMIGFVGLVVPHVLRLLLGPDHRLLIPAAFLAGGGFLVLADLSARMLLAPDELPVGVVTALLGGPFFLWLLRTRRAPHGF